MTLTSIEEYIEREWNHRDDGTYDHVITDVPGCARWVQRSLQRDPTYEINNLICYWFRKS